LSSILKALKKLETETTDKEPKQFVWPQPVDAKAAFNSRLQDKFSLKFLSYKVALFFFCSTTLILLIFISYSAHLQNKAEPVVPVVVADKNEKQIKKTPEIIEEKTEESIDAFISIESEPNPHLENADRETVEEKQKEKTDEILAVNASIEKEPIEENLIKEEAYIEPVKRTESGWLTLQGISWSSLPSKRMAVINSIIAREGKMVEGCRVVRIDKKYVVIEKNGEELMLTFD